MERVVSQLSAFLRHSVAADLRSASGTEFRGKFTGLPRELLRALWRDLASGGGIAVDAGTLPVLLVDDIHQAPSGASCVCSWPEVISFRGSLPRFVVLHHHDDEVAASVSSTVTNFGQGEISAIGRAGIDGWKASNPLVAEAVAHLPDSLAGDVEEREQIERLLAAAIEQAGEGENLDKEQANNLQWALVGEFARQIDVPGTTHDDLVATLGFPRRSPGSLDAASQVDALRRLAEHLQSSAIGPGIDDLIASNGTFEVALGALKAHLRGCCRDGPQFRASPSTFFRPNRVAGVLPRWWLELTVEAILALLDADRPPPDRLRVKLDPNNVLFNPGRGAAFYLVSGNPQFELERQPSTGREEAGPLPPDVLDGVRARRKTPRPADLTRRDAGWVDQQVPDHPKPIEYAFDADDYGGAIAKVIVLPRYKPGFILRCASARKVKLPRAAGARSRMTWNCDIELPSPGRYQVDIVFDAGRLRFEGAFLGASLATWPGSRAARAAQDWSVQRVVANSATSVTIQLDLESEGACVIAFGDGANEELLVGVAIDVGAEQPDSVASEYQALLFENIEPRRPRPQVVADSGRLQVWQQLRSSEVAGSAAGDDRDNPSYEPVAFSLDVADSPLPERGARRPILSLRRFLSDPRPTLEVEDVPRDLREARRTLHLWLRGLREVHQVNHLEELPLWELLRDETGREALLTFVRSYRSWLLKDDSPALWFESFAYFEPDSSSESVLEREPTALLLPPTHPLRLAWAVIAQSSLHDAVAARSPCPLASVLNPCAVPDGLALRCATGTGRADLVPMISVNTSSDYWAVLWNAKRLDRIRSTRVIRLFAETLGLQVEGVAGGLSEGQVRRAVADIDRLGCARGIQTSQPGSPSQCNKVVNFSQLT